MKYFLHQLRYWHRIHGPSLDYYIVFGLVLTFYGVAWVWLYGRLMACVK